MKAEQIERLRTCFEELSSRSGELIERFYSHLFQDHPELRKLFPEDTGQQTRHFLGAFTLSIENLDRPELFRQTLIRMGQRHTTYGVEVEHYPLVREALIAAVRDVGGEAITPEIADAWREGIDAISQIMIEGAAQSSRVDEDPFIDR